MCLVLSVHLTQHANDQSFSGDHDEFSNDDLALRSSDDLISRSQAAMLVTPVVATITHPSNAATNNVASQPNGNEGDSTNASAMLTYPNVNQLTSEHTSDLDVDGVSPDEILDHVNPIAIESSTMQHTGGRRRGSAQLKEMDTASAVVVNDVEHIMD